MKNCFVCMPLTKVFSEVYAGIEKEVHDTLGGLWKCTKADDTRQPGMVTEKVVSSVLNADLVIAVVADPREANTINPNVMYELGIAHSFRRPTIVIGDSKSELPFDIRSVETILIDFSDPAFLSELRRALQHSLRGTGVLEELEKRRRPRNPVSMQLSGSRVFIEDLPWLWGYCDVLKREREATTVWEITRDLYWAGESLFFESIKEAIRQRRKHYFMVEDHAGVFRKVESIKNGLLREFSRNEINELIHFVAIEAKYFVLWPIAVVLYDADLATRQGGIICEPMQSQVGDDAFDTRVRELFLQHVKSGDLDGFEKKLLDFKWTDRRHEATFDICLDGRVVEALATSFMDIWNEKILEEAQKKSGDEKTALLNAWVIGGASE